MPTTDHDAVLGLLDDLQRAWNTGDADAYGALFTDDATYVAYNGRMLTGRREITETHRWLFDGPLRGSVLGADSSGAERAEEPTVRFVAPDTAHVVSVGGMTLPGARAADPGHDSRVGLVAVRTADGWRLTAFQNTRRQPEPAAG